MSTSKTCSPSPRARARSRITSEQRRQSVQDEATKGILVVFRSGWNGFLEEEYRGDGRLDSGEQLRTLGSTDAQIQ